MESQPQNPEFRINPENFLTHVFSFKMKFECLDDKCCHDILMLMICSVSFNVKIEKC